MPMLYPTAHHGADFRSEQDPLGRPIVFGPAGLAVIERGGSRTRLSWRWHPHGPMTTREFKQLDTASLPVGVARSGDRRRRVAERWADAPRLACELRREGTRPGHALVTVVDPRFGAQPVRELPFERSDALQTVVDALNLLRRRTGTATIGRRARPPIGRPSVLELVTRVGRVRSPGALLLSARDPREQPFLDAIGKIASARSTPDVGAALFELSEALVPGHWSRRLGFLEVPPATWIRSVLLEATWLRVELDDPPAAQPQRSADELVAAALGPHTFVCPGTHCYVRDAGLLEVERETPGPLVLATAAAAIGRQHVRSAQLPLWPLEALRLAVLLAVLDKLRLSRGRGDAARARRRAERLICRALAGRRFAAATDTFVLDLAASLSRVHTEADRLAPLLLRGDR